MTADYLAKLNAEQRRAVEYGCKPLNETPPLLIIAGAGSGKTNTLAHRVAHLVVSGADPRRIMLLTFSRRAAAEMQRRVGRITAEALGPKAGVMTDALSWSGTFHAIGARLLREYALDIGLNSGFTIHDREDSADLMNLVRHDLGFSKMEKRFPMKGTCLSIYSRTVNAEAPLDEMLGNFFPWCADWETDLRKLFGAYVEAKQKQNVLDYDDLPLYWSQIMTEGAVAHDIADRFDHVLVDEYCPLRRPRRATAEYAIGAKCRRFCARNYGNTFRGMLKWVRCRRNSNAFTPPRPQCRPARRCSPRRSRLHAACRAASGGRRTQCRDA